MDWTSRFSWPASTRRVALSVLLSLVVAGCGGGGSSSGSGEDATQGTRESRTFRSRASGVTYPLSIYLPPSSAGARNELPVLYVLDGETWFGTAVEVAESGGPPAIIVAIHGAGRRNRDYVPTNRCTQDGGGHAAFFDFLRQELLPSIEDTIGGDPRRRALFGHSHGGSFALYAMFAESPGQHTFAAYLASDASVSCLGATADGWEQDHASAHSELPVRLHLSYATLGNHDSNRAYADAIAQRGYQDLDFVGKAYTGTHGGIVPQALREGMAFAFDTGP